MATNLRKYTTQEVLNKVYEDSSGNTIGINAATAKETLNAALDEANSRLNVSLAGGTISGDVTIAGDLTVNGGGSMSYSEVLTGDMKITNTAASTAFEVEQNTGAGTAVLIDQNADAQALTIDSESTTYAAVAINGKYGLYVTSDISGGYAAKFTRNIDESGSQPLVDIVDNHTSNAETTLRVQQDGSGDILNLFDGSTEVFTVLNGGNVGIGASAPSSMLDIAASASGDATLQLDSSANTSGISQIRSDTDRPSDGGSMLRIQAYNQGTEAGAMYFIRGSADTKSDIAFNTSNSERMRIDEDGKVGIGTSSPAATVLELVKDGGPSEIFVTSYRNDAGQPNFAGRHARGSKSSPSIVHDGDTLWQAQGYGYDGDGDFNSFAGGIQIQVDGTPGANDMPGRIRFLTTADGSGSWTERMRINSSGNVGISDGVTPDTNLHIHKATAGTVDSNSNAQLTIENNTHAGIQFLTPNSANNIIYFGDADDNDVSYLAYLHGSNEFEAFINGGVRLKLDANSRISLSNNDSGGTGGEDSTSGNTILGYLSGAAIASGGLNNTTIGHKAGNAISTADNNVFIGALAGSTHLTGGRNTAIGTQAMFNTDADSDSNSSISNVFIGAQAGGGTWAGETSNHNIGIGDLALGGALEGGDGTVAIGSSALGSLTSGTGNLAIGYQSSQSITTGTNNTIIGSYAMDAADGAESNNTALGYNAMGTMNNDSSIQNVAVGAFTLDDTQTNAVAGAVAVGYQALTALTSGARNTAVGYNTGLGITTSSDCVLVGYMAGEDMDSSGTTPQSCTYIGGYAGRFLDDGTLNTAVGHGAMEGTTGGSSCQENVAVGHHTLTAITTGDYNVAVGAESLKAITTQSNNTAVGYKAGEDSTGANNILVGYYAGSKLTGGYSTFIGYNAGLVHTSGGYNIAIGYGAMDDTNEGNNSLGSTENTFIGVDSGGGTWADTSSSYNVAIGNYAMDDALDGASYNTAVGQNSMSALTEGDYNTALGRASAHSLTTGTQNVLLGYGAVTSAASGQNQIVLGYETTGQANNSVTLGNASVTAVYMAQDSGATVHCGSLDLDNQTLNISATYIAANIGTKKTLGTTDASDNITGIKCHTEFEDSEFFGNLTGADIKAAVNTASSGESLDVTGALIEAEIASYGSTDVNDVYGLKTITDIDGNTVDSNVYGSHISVDVDGGTIAGDIYGIYISNDSEVNPSGSSFGLYIRSDTNQDNAIQTQDNSSIRFRVSDDGVVTSEGAMNPSTGMDYAEYFESKDGKEIAIGTTVKLDGTKIVACSDGDTPIGVIRPVNTSSVVAGGQEFHWESMFMKDDYGANVWESYTLTKWSEEITFEEYSKRGKDETGGAIGGIVTDSKVEGSKAIEAKDAVLDEDGKELEPAVKAVAAVPDKYYREHKYHSDRLPSGVTAPKDAETITPSNKRQKLNPDYDASKSYKSREERDEWHVVGLLGQIPITKGQPVASNWIKMKDVSDTVEMYFVK